MLIDLDRIEQAIGLVVANRTRFSLTLLEQPSLRVHTLPVEEGRFRFRSRVPLFAIEALLEDLYASVHQAELEIKRIAADVIDFAHYFASLLRLFFVLIQQVLHALALFNALQATWCRRLEESASSLCHRGELVSQFSYLVANRNILACLVVN